MHELDLLKIAESDLNASMLLYENKLYPQSVFSFQQSIEKAFKAFWCWNGISYDDVLNAGHNNLKIINKKNKNVAKGLQELISNYDFNIQAINNQFVNFNKLNNIKKEFDSIYGLLSNLNDYDLLNLSLDDIQSVIVLIDNSIILLNEDFLVDHEKKDSIKMIFSTLGISSIKDFDDFFNILSTSLLPFASKMFFCNISLFYLSLITYQHVSKSRYIDDKVNFNPSSFYNSDLPLIVKFPELFAYTNKTINICKELFNTSNPL